MNNITELVLIESRSARTSHLSNVSDERALETLNKAKALVMAVWQGTGIATTVQLAEYYEISEDLARQTYHRNRKEFQLDGVRTLKGNELKSLLQLGHDSLSQPKSTTVLTAWTPRAALRLGMVLRDSEIARQVRSTILDIVEAANPEKQIDRTAEIATNPKAKTLDELTIHDLRCLLVHRSNAHSVPFQTDLTILAGIDPIFWLTPQWCLEYLLARLQNKTDSILAKYDLGQAIWDITNDSSKSSEWHVDILKAKTELADRLKRQESILNNKTHQRAYQKFKTQLADFQAQGQLV